MQTTQAAEVASVRQQPVDPVKQAAIKGKPEVVY